MVGWDGLRFVCVIHVPVCPLLHLSNREKLGMDQVFVVWTSKSGLNQPKVVWTTDGSYHFFLV